MNSQLADVKALHSAEKNKQIELQNYITRLNSEFEVRNSQQIVTLLYFKWLSD